MNILRAISWIFALAGLLTLAVFGIGFGYLEEPPLALNIAGGVGAALVIAWFALNWSMLVELGKGAAFARTATSLFAVLLTGGIGVTVNIVAHRYDKRWDLTETKRYTLSQQSIDVVSKLDRDVEILAFFGLGSPEGENFRDLVERYKEHTTLLKVEVYDPMSNPILAEQNKVVTDAGTVILKAGEATQRLESGFDEEAVTNALIRLTSSKEHKVCFVTGHGEREIDDESTAEGLGMAKVRLEGTNYKVAPINLLSNPPTPETCEVVVLASPRADLVGIELDRLADYVAAGGGLVVALDPVEAPATAAAMARYGVKVGNDVVLEADPYRQTQNGPTEVLLDPSSYDIHPVTSKLQGATLLSLARSVSKGPDVAGLTVQEIVHASEKSWAETSIQDANATLEPTPGTDLIGKVSLAVAVEVTDPSALAKGAVPAAPAAPTMPTDAPSLTPPGLPGGAPEDPPAAPEVVPTDPTAGILDALKAGSVPVAAAPTLSSKAGGKVLVFGDGDFMSNRSVVSGTNQDLFLNTVAWMVGEEDQISVRANEAGKGKLNLSLVTLFLSVVTVVLILPGLAVFGAVGTWLRRRRA